MSEVTLILSAIERGDPEAAAPAALQPSNDLLAQDEALQKLAAQSGILVSNDVQPGTFWGKGQFPDSKYLMALMALAHPQ